MRIKAQEPAYQSISIFLIVSLIFSMNFTLAKAESPFENLQPQNNIQPAIQPSAAAIPEAAAEPFDVPSSQEFLAQNPLKPATADSSPSPPSKSLFWEDDSSTNTRTIEFNTPVITTGTNSAHIVITMTGLAATDSVKLTFSGKAQLITVPMDCNMLGAKDGKMLWLCQGDVEGLTANEAYRGQITVKDWRNIEVGKLLDINFTTKPLPSRQVPISNLIVTPKGDSVSVQVNVRGLQIYTDRVILTIDANGQKYGAGLMCSGDGTNVNFVCTGSYAGLSRNTFYQAAIIVEDSARLQVGRHNFNFQTTDAREINLKNLIVTPASNKVTVDVYASVMQPGDRILLNLTVNGQPQQLEMICRQGHCRREITGLSAQMTYDVVMKAESSSREVLGTRNFSVTTSGRNVTFTGWIVTNNSTSTQVTVTANETELGDEILVRLPNVNPVREAALTCNGIQCSGTIPGLTPETYYQALFVARKNGAEIGSQWFDFKTKVEHKVRFSDWSIDADATTAQISVNAAGLEAGDEVVVSAVIEGQMREFTTTCQSSTTGTQCQATITGLHPQNSYQAWFIARKGTSKFGEQAFSFKTTPLPQASFRNLSITQNASKVSIAVTADPIPAGTQVVVTLTANNPPVGEFILGCNSENRCSGDLTGLTEGLHYDGSIIARYRGKELGRLSIAFDYGIVNFRNIIISPATDKATVSVTVEGLRASDQVVAEVTDSYGTRKRVTLRCISTRCKGTFTALTSSSHYTGKILVLTSNDELRKETAIKFDTLKEREVILSDAKANPTSYSVTISLKAAGLQDGDTVTALIKPGEINQEIILKCEDGQCQGIIAPLQSGTSYAAFITAKNSQQKVLGYTTVSFKTLGRAPIFWAGMAITPGVTKADVKVTLGPLEPGDKVIAGITINKRYEEFTLAACTGPLPGSGSTLSDCTGTITGLTANTKYNASIFVRDRNNQIITVPLGIRFQTRGAIFHNLRVRPGTTDAGVSVTINGLTASDTVIARVRINTRFQDFQMTCSTSSDCTGEIIGLTAGTTYDDGEIIALTSDHEELGRVALKFTTKAERAVTLSNIAADPLTRRATVSVTIDGLDPAGDRVLAHLLIDGKNYERQMSCQATFVPGQYGCQTTFYGLKPGTHYEGGVVVQPLSGIELAKQSFNFDTVLERKVTFGDAQFTPIYDQIYISIEINGVQPADKVQMIIHDDNNRIFKVVPLICNTEGICEASFPSLRPHIRYTATITAYDYQEGYIMGTLVLYIPTTLGAAETRNFESAPSLANTIAFSSFPAKSSMFQPRKVSSRSHSSKKLKPEKKSKPSFLSYLYKNRD